MPGQSAQRQDWEGDTEQGVQGARHTWARVTPFLPATPLPRDAKEQKEELHFFSYSDSGSSTKITGICYLDCNLDRDFRIQKIRK